MLLPSSLDATLLMSRYELSAGCILPVRWTAFATRSAAVHGFGRQLLNRPSHFSEVMKGIGGRYRLDDVRQERAACAPGPDWREPNFSRSGMRPSCRRSARAGGVARLGARIRQRLTRGGDLPAAHPYHFSVQRDLKPGSVIRGAAPPAPLSCALSRTLATQSRWSALPKKLACGQRLVDWDGIRHMAGVRNDNSDLSFEADLFRAADKLRGNLEPSEYKHVALGLIFLKYISEAFVRA
jgi:HsdM N-terminal domain